MLIPTLSVGADNGNERAKLPVIGASGASSSYTLPQSGNYTITQGVDFSGVGRELFIQNDGNANITVVVNCLEGTIGFLMQPGEQFDERLPLFSSVVVTSAGNWRWRIRGNAS